MKKTIIILSIILPINLISQVGIGTKNPEAAFHIDAAKNNDTTSNSIKYLDDVVVTEDGKMGVGNINPITRLDVRNDLEENIIGIGKTNQTAAIAGAGAVQYYEEANSWGLSYSDGSQWIKLTAIPIKVLINANNSSALNIPNNTITTLTTWNKTEDTTNSFNDSEGVFVAPRTGNYLININLATQSASIPNNSFIETIIESNSTLGVPQFRCLNTYPGYTTGSATNSTGNNCTAILRLQQGNQVRFKLLHNFGGNRNLIADSSLNTLSITEL